MFLLTLNNGSSKKLNKAKNNFWEFRNFTRRQTQSTMGMKLKINYKINVSMMIYKRIIFMINLKIFTKIKWLWIDNKKTVQKLLIRFNNQEISQKITKILKMIININKLLSLKKCLIFHIYNKISIKMKIMKIWESWL